MKPMLATVVAGLLVCTAAAGAVPLQELETEGQAWWAHVEKLAADDMEGRFTGTPGYQRAADYVAERFRAYGLEPAGSNGYFQPVHLVGQKIINRQSSVSLVSGGHVTALKVGEQILISSRLAQLPQVSAELVFIGYGLHLPEQNYDDFAGVDLRGKIVVTISGGPKTLPSALKAHARGGDYWKAIERAGAIGALSIANPKTMDIPWSRQILLSQSEGMYLQDRAQRDQTRSAFNASFDPAAAEILFAQSGHTLAEVLALSDQSAPIKGFPLKIKLEAKVVSVTRRVVSPNVVAVLPGSDPKLAAEHLVLSAHLDHLGVGEPINGDRIYNGAMDNAAGVASILETSRLMATAPQKPRRSVVFLAVTGEERGLLGSRAFASKPTIGAGSIVANLNIDMFLPLSPLNGVVVYGMEESTLGAVAAKVAAAQGLKAATDPEPDRNLFIRSDQYSFIRNGIPALSLKSWSPPGSPAGDKQKAWLTERYHGPADDLNQPVDQVAAAKLNRYLLALLRQVAGEPQRPQWLATSFFSRIGKPASSGQETAQPSAK